MIHACVYTQELVTGEQGGNLVRGNLSDLVTKLCPLTSGTWLVLSYLLTDLKTLNETLKNLLYALVKNHLKSIEHVNSLLVFLSQCLYLN